jgi:ankyrin repeat protein
LLSCIKRGHLKIVQLLLEHKASMTKTSPRGKNSPLHKAVKRGHPSLVKLLLDNKCEPNTQNRYGDTPLMIAVKQNNEDIMKMLLEHKADASITNAEGKTPLHEAVQEKNLDIIKVRKTTIQIVDIFSASLVLAPMLTPVKSQTTELRFSTSPILKLPSSLSSLEPTSM